MAASPIPSFSDCPWVFHALLRP
ncbi:prephenate dehydratase, partial [Salmonella enterica subsp. enterica serovar Typhimurium]|nr:prephenate dehydratase [Salmonella enterica subsp. enterica serovar Typhimurium]ECX5507015.1 prephenate dehydratase [Salmonella enterica subsp. enterica serovar Typhimurium]ECX5530620.1 prephenate dehydratase [Salmonella enterica subsp. enterica serovar Typhimurium]EDA1821401.1 prephenate dehydratase [Salmonella enterica subsp. enterica serovar Typhimurium]EDK3480204.1 prephenate dehydratase [Salmonella enterica subsp. enterica serovar Typhimurium]